MKKFSIITISYNSSKTIEQTINSVINQSYKNFEYIIIDGGSTDGTVEIIEKYKSAVNIFISEKDYGIYDAMNKGIKLATGDWVGIINSDDFYELNIFEKINNEIENNINFEIIHGNLNIVDLSSKFVIEIKPSDKLSDINFTMNMFHPTVFVKRSLYEKERLFDLNFKLSSDWDLLKFFFNNGYKFHYLDLTIANFRQGGAGSGFKKIHLIERFKIRHKHFKIYFIFYDIKDTMIYFVNKFAFKKSLF